MGKIQLITKEQKLILDEVSKSNFLSSSFYFTGGTALSCVYLQHRYSDDLDFFSKEQFDNQILFTLIEGWSKKYNFTFGQRFVEVVYIFDLTFKNQVILKLDFAYYPSRQRKPFTTIDNINIEGVKVKFNVKIDPFLLATDLLKVEDFDYLPKMIKPLDIEALKLFFRQKAKEISGRSLK